MGENLITGTSGTTPAGDGSTSADAVPAGGDLASRIAQRSLAKREAGYASEIRRLLDAALAEIRTRGTTARVRVADVVAAAGLSNDAFYRHFPSKDALLGALLEDGTERLLSYVTHQMAKEPTPEGRIRRWAAAVLSQATDDIATTTRAILWNAGGPTTDFESGPPLPGSRLAALLRPAFAELGSADPDFDAAVVSHATVGVLTDYLWRRAQPTPDEVDRIVAFALRAVTPV
ncbi:TetR/AcrR family transcriptional regulator [Nocardia sp. alder85J]|uniref:TetR/AcrR family transcriptional regulator n=1 Tax=Nocardia sp. alder85J TaxID=2862949 RepID=UPI001CD669E6|nr:TetR/AcrR family transcriptional regulator [Nocardia sp. alder85J]MCX4090729.1 TetR/AcrR family transcriptional regulator [Nocardia sp. alder85J]